jgi:hypothetical protein
MGGGCGVKQPVQLDQIPGRARLVVPVIGAGGGSGRSVVAGLLALGLASVSSPVVMDTAPRLASPWPTWIDGEGAGLASLPPRSVTSKSGVATAASVCRGVAGATWHVLTDQQAWSAPPLDLPDDPQAWYQLSSLGPWQAVVIDTAHPAAHDMVDGRARGGGTTTAWCDLPFTVPVLCTPTTGPGVALAQTAVMAAEAAGLPLERFVLATVATSSGRPPTPVRAGLTMLEPKVGRTVSVPFDEHVAAAGLRESNRLKPRTAASADALARAVLSLAHAAWGTPLPAAAAPAPLTLEGGHGAITSITARSAALPGR